MTRDLLHKKYISEEFKRYFCEIGSNWGTCSECYVWTKMRFKWKRLLTGDRNVDANANVCVCVRERFKGSEWQDLNGWWLSNANKMDLEENKEKEWDRVREKGTEFLAFVRLSGSVFFGKKLCARPKTTRPYFAEEQKCGRCRCRSRSHPKMSYRIFHKSS